MKADPTIKRIRDARHQISQECGHNPVKLIEYYMEFQKKFTARIINKKLPIKRHKKSPGLSMHKGT
jgi:hypothetical protein